MKNVTMICVALISSLAGAQTVSRVSVSTEGVESSRFHLDSGGSSGVSIDVSGRTVLYASSELLFNSAATDGLNCFAFDRLAHQTRVVSLLPTGTGVPNAVEPVLSDDGAFLLFSSSASIPNNPPANGYMQVYLRDQRTGVIRLLSVDANGLPGNRNAGRASIDARGTRVVFESRASNLVAGDTNNAVDVFLWDVSQLRLERLSVSIAGVEGNSHSAFALISSDGRLAYFTTGATNLLSSAANAGDHLLLRDLQSGAIELVSSNLLGVATTRSSNISRSISEDGRFACFDSSASDLVANDNNRAIDVFVRDRLLGITIRVSEGTGGIEGNGASQRGLISRDGRYVSFLSDSSNLGLGGSGATQVYRHDRQTGVTEMVSTEAFGNPGNLGSLHSAISGDGSIVAFISGASNLVPDDGNGLVGDVFVRDMACPSIAGAYGRACTGSNGVRPLLYLAGCPTRGQDVLVWLRGTLPYAPAAMLFGRTRGNFPFGTGGCEILIDQPFGVAVTLATGADGVGALGFRLPPWPSFVGDFTVQALVLDPGLPQLFASTRGIDLRVR